MSNAATLQRVFALQDEQDFTAVPDLLAPGFTAVLGGNPPMSAQEWLGMSQMFFAAFPDGKHAIDETFEAGDHVALRGSFSGTHTGELMGIPPTGKEITITFMNFDRFADGKLAEHRAEVDMLGLMQQLGAVPS